MPNHPRRTATETPSPATCAGTASSGRGFPLLAGSGLLAVACLAATVPAHAAGLFQGKVTRLLLNQGTTPARVSIDVGAHHSACPAGLGATWMAFENADTGVGKTWTAALLAARAAGWTVTIEGNGTCDQWGIEGISYIDINP
jgi:hypothetical protein